MDCIILFAWVGFLVHAFSFLIGLLYNRCRKLVFVALGVMFFSVWSRFFRAEKNLLQFIALLPGMFYFCFEIEIVNIKIFKRMKFFIDTANLAQIREANEMGVLDGVTTNPSLMAKEGIKGTENCKKHYVDICNIVNGDVSAEVIATDYEGMIKEGEELAALHPNIVVKVPCIADGIKAIKYFTDKGIRTNCTLVFSPGQALLAAKAGATYVSPFVGRLDDITSDGIELVGKIVDMYRYYGFHTQVLAASIRTTQHIIQCIEAGADVATCPLPAIKGLLNHPLTDIGLAKFLEDYKKVNG